MKWTDYDSETRYDKRELALAEDIWKQQRRPYLNIWPSVQEGLSRVRLNIPLRQLVEPPRDIPPVTLVRFSEEERLTQGGCSLDLFLLAYNAQYPVIGCYTFLTHPDDSRSMLRYTMRDDEELENLDKGLLEITDYPVAQQQIEDVIHLCVSAARIAVGTLLMMEDPELVTPVVIKKDQAKYDATRDQKFVEKARRRGNIGWDVGKHLEVSPHYRRPHFGIRYKGKGEANRPVLVPIKGAIVHRDKLGKVPTGYLDDE